MRNRVTAYARQIWVSLSAHAGALFIVFCQFLIAEYLLVFAAWYLGAHGLADKSGTPLGADFLNVYSAGILADRGQPGLAYDWNIHGQTEQMVAGYAAPYFGWHYPPLFLGVAAVFALMPYMWAFAFYIVAGLAGYAAIIRRLVPPAKEALWAVAAFPGVFVNISNGQNGFITTALFGAGFLWLETNPWLAGIMFGLMAYKPQFFIVIPFALAIGGYGRVLLASVVAASAGVALSWLLFGTTTWDAFFHSTDLTRHIILEQGATGWKKIQSVFSLIRMWGGSIETAYIVQGFVAVIALGCMTWVWRRPTSIALRAGALCAALLLTTPYVLDYDLIILAVPLALWVRHERNIRFLAAEKILLAALWLLPLWARGLGGDHLPLTPPLLMALMGLCLYKSSTRNLKTSHAE